MIAHIVLFQPRPDLPAEDVQRLVSAFEEALANIPMIRRASVGRRVRMGRHYEQLMAVDYPYAAVLEFDDVAGLRGYLEHPAHGDVGAAVFQAAGNILVYDYEMGLGASGLIEVAGRT
jgi:hypothetical protein